MISHAFAVTFRPDEAALLQRLDVLLGRSCEALPWSAVEVAPNAALLAAARDRIVRAVLRYLTEEGGYRERVFLRDGRRVRGRPWDGELSKGFVLRFGTASRDLWLRAALHLPTLTSFDTTNTSRRRRLIHEMVATTNTASGDWIVYALAREALPRWHLSEADAREIIQRLSLGSPWVALLDASLLDSEEVLRAHLKPLVAPEHVRIVECAEARLARAWIARARVDWRLPWEELWRRWSALGRCLHAWLDVLELARRMDLARPLLDFSARLATEVFAAGTEAARAQVGSAPGVRSIEARERLLAAVAQVAELGPRLLRLRDRFALERYGDERHEEGQLYVGATDRVLVPLRRPVEALRNAFQGVLG